jgi:Zn-dependent protease
MTPTRQGSIRLFRFAGIDVYLNWLWFLAPIYLYWLTAASYSSPIWSVVECLGLFLIVLLHEFGHALACRQVGGQANLIVLWPLGGVAYVAPPLRPGAVLWSIAAGPLVNVVLAPVLGVIALLASAAGLAVTMPNVYHFLWNVCWINIGLLVFNLLPIYPLDGGQILQAVLWFVLGRARSLMVATIVGFAAVPGLVVIAALQHNPMLGVLCVFIALICWRGLMQARVLARIAKLPRRSGFACPSCKQPPIVGPIWRCDRCLKPFDTFETQASCPHCGAQYAATRCPECGRMFPWTEWLVAPPPVSTRASY